jgi:hypothetical protein
LSGHWRTRSQYNRSYGKSYNIRCDDSDDASDPNRCQVTSKHFVIATASLSYTINGCTEWVNYTDERTHDHIDFPAVQSRSSNQPGNYACPEPDETSPNATFFVGLRPSDSKSDGDDSGAKDYPHKCAGHWRKDLIRFNDSGRWKRNSLEPTHRYPDVEENKTKNTHADSKESHHDVSHEEDLTLGCLWVYIPL